MVMLRRVPVLVKVRPARQKEAVQGWETEGGAIAEQPRANPTAQAGPERESRKGQETRRMSNLIAKIRHWLHLDPKPKT